MYFETNKTEKSFSLIMTNLADFWHQFLIDHCIMIIDSSCLINAVNMVILFFEAKQSGFNNLEDKKAPYLSNNNCQQS